jgi:hypothetical protein
VLEKGNNLKKQNRDPAFGHCPVLIGATAAVPAEQAVVPHGGAVAGGVGEINEPCDTRVRSLAA